MSHWNLTQLYSFSVHRFTLYVNIFPKKSASYVLFHFPLLVSSIYINCFCQYGYVFPSWSFHVSSPLKYCFLFLIFSKNEGENAIETSSLFHYVFTFKRHCYRSVQNSYNHKYSPFYFAKYLFCCEIFQIMRTVGWRERNQQDATNLMFIIKLYLNIFRTSLCPSSGEQECALPHMVWCPKHIEVKVW